MFSNEFKKRMENFSSKDEILAFNLAMVSEGLEIVKSLSDKNIGWEEVEKRLGEYKSWDPDILRVDKDTENTYRKRLEQWEKPIILLSEEAGRVEINTDQAGSPLYVVCDPFDGSYLFKHGIKDFWYSSLAFYDSNFNPVCCCVGDCVSGKIAYAWKDGAYLADIDAGKIIKEVKLDKKYRQSMGRPDVLEMDGASIESYAMKPKKFLVPLVDKYRELLLPFKFFLPNGGPYGFVDVAEGKIDVYFAMKQPFVDVFSGIFIAQQAEVIVTDFYGNPVRCSDNVKTVLDVVVSTNAKLHEKVLKKIAECENR
ncbi:MAG TPA: inositol monophosphatase family protein [bacterium]|nr:inositol monophosphatase family protein [bacterium]HOL34396.1 inositol monophosphatase family protein [bacterium]HPP07961.1 inositol monophosphatase family protein [bacterium]